VTENSDLSIALINLDEKKVYRILDEKIAVKVSGKETLEELQGAMSEIGKKFEKKELFVPELIFSGIIMKNAMKILEPLLKNADIKPKGKVIMGTVYGDIHDIGKDLVKSILEGSGYEVIDVGTNVNPEKFIEAVKSTNSKLLGLSCLLTVSFESIKKTIDAIKDAGLRDKIKIMIGGAPTSEMVKEKTGADFYGKDAFSAVKIAEKVYN
jgi:methylmalonyl-CoA mutase cobalamin-binding domain/chain